MGDVANELVDVQYVRLYFCCSIETPVFNPHNVANSTNMYFVVLRMYYCQYLISIGDFAVTRQ